LYKEIYWLVRDIGFTPDYIENLAPAERKLYWNAHVEQLKREEQDAQGVNNYSPLSENLPGDMVSGKIIGNIR
jgi:hypothetical protein